MIQLRAVSRLKASAALLEEEVSAAFSKEHKAELISIKAHLQAMQVIFKLDEDHLYHKSNMQDVEKEARVCADELNNLGYNLRIRPNIFSNNTFGLKGKDGIVLQRLGSSLQIFFSV